MLLHPVTTPKQVVFIVESPFSDQDYKRFGIERLRRQGLSVTVWDISCLTLPRSRLQLTIAPTQIDPTVITSNEELQARVCDLRVVDVLILLALVYRGSSAESKTILRDLLKSPALVTTVDNGCQPNLSITSRIYLLMSSFLHNPSRAGIAFIAKCRSVQLACKLCRRTSTSKHEDDRTDSARPLDIIWAGASIVNVEKELIKEQTLVRYVHAADYDLVKDLPPSAVTDEKFCVFLDTMGPLHPDNVTLDSPDVIAISENSDIVCAHLTRIEAQMSFDSVIAAHPRAEPGVMEPWYGHRRIIYGRTPELIASSQFVVAQGDSTSLLMAVLLRKPVMIITALPLRRAIARLRKDLMRELRLQEPNFLNTHSSLMVPRVNERAYKKFVEKYVKRPGTDDRHFWDVVAEDILSRSAD
ncbi:MAG: hypothetical protein JW384_00505 [Nitrosomonadaceae bacterium]|nr:hypothetical protein [Nitrosomonadaceae bacterium]